MIVTYLFKLIHESGDSGYHIWGLLGKAASMRSLIYLVSLSALAAIFLQMVQTTQVTSQNKVASARGFLSSCPLIPNSEEEIWCQVSEHPIVVLVGCHVSSGSTLSEQRCSSALPALDLNLTQEVLLRQKIRNFLESPPGWNPESCL